MLSQSSDGGAAYHSGFMMAAGGVCVETGEIEAEGLRVERGAGLVKVAIEADGWLEVKGASAGQVSSTSGKDDLVGWALGWEDGMGGGSASHVQGPHL